MRWRQAQREDIDAVKRIAGLVHPTLPESREVFGEKLALFPDGCLILEDEGETAGYCVSHPWLLGSAPAINRLMKRLPADPDCMFIHDVALLPRARGRGAVKDLVDRLLAIAQQLEISKLALVSVYDTYPLWQRFGFELVGGDDRSLATYGASARYMVRDVDRAHGSDG